MRTQLRYLLRDLATYSLVERFTEPTIVATVVYRLGRGAQSLPQPLRAVASLVYAVSRVFARVVSSGIHIPRSADIGPGLRIHHSGPVVMGAGVKMGSDCTIGHGVTVARVDRDSGWPVVGDRVVLSSYAQVLGDVTVGDDAKVGAMAVVLEDVPAAVTAAGVPARVVGQRKPHDG